jgi:hypothetical protein
LVGFFLFTQQLFFFFSLCLGSEDIPGLEALLSWGEEELEDGINSSPEDFNSDTNSGTSSPSVDNATASNGGGMRRSDGTGESKTNGTGTGSEVEPATSLKVASNIVDTASRIQHASKLKAIHKAKRRQMRRSIVGLTRQRSSQAEEDAAYELLKPTRVHESQFLQHGGGMFVGETWSLCTFFVQWVHGHSSNLFFFVFCGCFLLFFQI